MNSRREPIAEVIADPATDATLRRRLELAVRARDFAMTELGLPDNGSYRTFADLGRRYATWNLFAAPELSVEPKRWCFPIAGCVSYRGYFDEEHAARAAARAARARLRHLRRAVHRLFDARPPARPGAEHHARLRRRRARRLHLPRARAPGGVCARRQRLQRGFRHRRRDRGAAALARARGRAGRAREVPRRAHAPGRAPPR